MGAYNRNQESTQFYKLKINKENDTPYFYRQEKKNDTWVEAEAFNAMSGQLVGINVKSYEWEGKQKQSLELEMRDSETTGRVVISMGFNNMTRSLLNSLAGCDSIGVLDLNATRWGKKGQDKKYPTVFIENNGQKTSWKYQKDEIPPVEEIKNKKGEVISRDDTDTNEFWKLVIQNEIIPKIHASKEVQREMAHAAPAEKKGYTSELAPDNVPSDDLPF